MRFSTVQNYIEAIDTIKNRLRTQSNIIPKRDSAKALLYKVSLGVVCFDLEDHKVLYLFLNEQSYEAFIIRNPKINLSIGQLYVSTSDSEGFWADFAIGDSCSTIVDYHSENQDSRLYSEGLRAIDKNGKWGFVDINEQVVIDYLWDDVEDFSESRSLVQKDGLYGLINNQGDVIVEPIYDELSWDGSNYLYGELMGLWGVIDRSGKIVVNFEWDWIGEFSYGYAIVQKDDKNGFVNKKGDLVIVPKYDQATSFNEYGIASVSCDENIFFIDTLDRRV